ncbi:MAG: SMP-30/gluconolactonase/LRE family protein [Anaerolineaceae bacterium]|nr:SMP-30/gluconolactonase/LRE family protein [Anaerolineaceae bacterium]
MTSVEHVVASQCILGEGPVWHSDEQKLYWVDIKGKAIHTYQPDSGSHHVFQFGEYIAALAIRRQGGFIVAGQKHLHSWDGHSETLTPIIEVEPDLPENRFNDGAVDKQGRFWIGTMPDIERTPTGNLYRLDPDLTLHHMVSGVYISNGIGWPLDDHIMYYTDSIPKAIYTYDFDAATGSISNRGYFLHTPDLPGVPDGMTVDSENHIWTARWDGYNVTRYSPEGEVVQVIDLPTAHITSVTFGGPDLRDLYITSAKDELTADQLANEPMAGDLFRVRVDVPGQPEPRFAG